MSGKKRGAPSPPFPFPPDAPLLRTTHIVGRRRLVERWNLALDGVWCGANDGQRTVKQRPLKATHVVVSRGLPEKEGGK